MAAKVDILSTHRIEVVEVGPILPHPNADRLEITHAFGWQVCVAKGAFVQGQRAVYIPPDYEVPKRPEFAFLFPDGVDKAYERTRAKRLRGEWSQGFLIPVPAPWADCPVGTNLIVELGIRRYEPPLPSNTGGSFVKPPELWIPKFDLEPYQRYAELLMPGELVTISEKLHGTSARFVHHDNQQFVGGRNHWLADAPESVYWQAFRQHPGIGEFCQTNPDAVLFGEVFGPVQSLRYGAGKNQVFFAAFAALVRGHWLDWDQVRHLATLYQFPLVPVLYEGPFQPEILTGLADGPSTWPGADHLREGVVVVPAIERADPEIGRVALKLVSNEYLAKAA